MSNIFEENNINDFDTVVLIYRERIIFGVFLFSDSDNFYIIGNKKNNIDNILLVYGKSQNIYAFKPCKIVLIEKYYGQKYDLVFREITSARARHLMGIRLRSI